jgi:hypothetical protein
MEMKVLKLDVVEKLPLTKELAKAGRTEVQSAVIIQQQFWAGRYKISRLQQYSFLSGNFWTHPSTNIS